MTTNIIKIVACLVMLIDHSGEIFKIASPDLYIVIRLIGRIAFPIFAFCIAQGFIHTKDVRKYLTRLLLFAIIVHVPYSYAFYDKILYFGYFNIMYTLFAGLLALALYEKFDKRFSWIFILVIGVIAQVVNLEYGLYGILLIFAMYYGRDDFGKLAICVIGISMVDIVYLWIRISRVNLVYALQFFSILSLIPLYFYNGKKGKLNLKYLFYIFYPTHLLILKFIAVSLDIAR